MSSIKRGLRFVVVLALCTSFAPQLWRAPLAAAAPLPQDGALRIEAIYAPNLIVDSNAESPSTYAPRSGTLGARVCNDGAAPLTDVTVAIGDYNDATPGASTPGLYPARAVATALYAGTFRLTHEGGSAGRADASRFLLSLAPGACTVQYWLMSYPRLDSLGRKVTGDIKPADDLWLQYDMWASAMQGATPRQVNITKTVTMRNEISASANKIWPNGDNKVPAQYLQAIADAFGWGTFVPGGGSSAYPGDLVRTQGVWYDLGVVGAGFDNDGNFVPDHNAWLQPIGDPNGYDPGCFRLARTYGILIVKLVGGGERLMPFLDNLYFQNIPDNTGTVGLVYYEYVALNGTCASGLSPYQEVASGYDNEKFNADFGAAIPPLQSRLSPITLAKGVDKATTAIPASLQYALTFANPGPNPTSAFALGAPLVISDTVPLGTTYVAGSATANNTLPAGVPSYRVLYSTNNGLTWTTTEPAANTVTTIQWWLGGDMPVNTTGVVRYQVQVPGAYTASQPPVVPNIGGLSFGNNPPFAKATATTLILGANSLSGSVFSDNGAAALFANGAKDSGEPVFPNVTVRLYLDTNNDGVGDVLVGTTATNAGGAYSFGNLPDGNFVVEVDPLDTDIPAGFTNTNAIRRSVALDAARTDPNPVNAANIDFGFAPALVVGKRLPAGTTEVYEGDTVQYTIDLANKLPGTGSAAQVNCSRVAWAEVADTTSSGGSNGFFLSRPNAAGVGGPDGLYASSAFANNIDEVRADTFTMNQTGAITKVEAIFSVYGSGAFVDDGAGAELLTGATSLGTATFTPAQLNALSGQANQGLLSWDVTGLKTWAFGDFTGNTLDLKFTARKVGSVDGRTLYIDAMGFRVTTNQKCGPTVSTTINPLPLVDTYDPAKLQFLSSTPPADSAAPAGTLTWNNLGALYPGETTSVLVRFKALQPATTPINVSNTATVSAAKFANGLPTNPGASTVTVPLRPTGSLAGVVWSDLGTLGWVSINGYEAGDRRIPGATVTLFACTSTATGAVIAAAGNAAQGCTGNGNGGAWTQLAVTTTDASGAYRFDGLRDGFYRTVVDTASLPGTLTQRADPNVRPGTCAGAACDSQSNAAGDNLDGGFLARVIGANDLTNINYGYSVNPALYGKIWEDSDGNGSQSAQEPLLSGASVTVSLYANATCAGAPLATQTTTDGAYRFPNLTAGTTYCVATSTPLGWTRTGENDGSVNNQIVKTLVAGEVSGPHDFGFRRAGSSTIGDTLYYDWNGNGAQDSGDEGVRNVAVSLYRDMDGNGKFDPAIDALVAATATNASGQYLFSGLAAGNYLVVVDSADPDLPATVFQTADPNEAGVCAVCDNRSLVAGVDGASAYLTHDFGYKPSGGGSIGDTVWKDLNGDGVQLGVLEAGIANIAVELLVDLNGDGTYVVAAATSTDASGNYLFSNLPAGAYRVRVAATDPDLPRDAFGNPVAPTTATSQDVTLAANGSILTADFGFAPLGAIGDTIYWDANGDGEQDWTESGIPGVTVTLCRDLNNDGVCGAGETATTATTDARGKYLFTGLPTLPGSGTYLVSVGAIAGNPTLTADPNADGAPCTAPGAVGCDGKVSVKVLPGSNFMGADFGYRPSLVIGDTLWIDANGDGVQNAGEAGIPNVTVRLCNTATGVCATTATDADGTYFFQNPANGDYTLSVDLTDPDLPAGLAVTADPDGAPNGSTPVVVSGGAVTTMGVPCASCGLSGDFGFRYAGALSLSGTVCQDGSTADRICGSGPSGVVTATGEFAYPRQTVYLSKWTDANGNGVIDAGETVAMGSTTTDANGDYAFSGLPGGVYVVALAAPADNLRMVTQQGDTPGSRVVIDPASGTTSAAYQVVTVNAAVQQMDFAFVSTVASDFGDLPASYSTTLSGAPEGPRHQLSGPSTLYLGATPPDSEANGLPTAAADGDGADEDGVTFPARWSEAAGGGSVQVSVQGSGWLIGWIDLDKNGRFDKANEMVISQAVSAGAQTYAFDVPVGTFSAGSRTIYSRFRLFPSRPLIPALAYSGTVAGGEVEDYVLQLSPTAVTLAGFTAARQADGTVLVRWETAVELNTAGFRVLRGSQGRPATSQTPTLIPAQGDMGGFAYEWVDVAASADMAHSYWLEEIETGGAVNRYGPANVQGSVVRQVFMPLASRAP